MDSVIGQEAAGRDEFGAQRKGALSVHLAEVGRLAAPDQGLQAQFPRGAHDFDLEVAAAGCPLAVVGGAAGSPDTRIGAGMDRQLARWSGKGRQLPFAEPAALHDGESVSPESPGFRRNRNSGAERSAVSMSRTGPPGAIPGEVPARYLEERLDVEVAVVRPQVGAEGNAPGVSQQPGGLMIAGGRIRLQCCHPQDHGEGKAVTTHAAAVGGALWRGGGHSLQDTWERRLVGIAKRGLYICEAIHKGPGSGSGPFGGWSDPGSST